MSVFTTYFKLGFLHICSWQATDHLTFLLALCAPYVLADCRRVLVLVTSFTVGHSITLALATLGIVGVNSPLVEALIPVTIMVTALVDMWRIRPALARQPIWLASRVWTVPNVLAVVFGLIHGLGFSTYLRELLGTQRRPIAELLSFNLGVELGQLLVVSTIMLLGFIVLRGFRVARRDWVLVTSSAALGIAALLLSQLRG